jgi:peptide/nickel transport system permease protein
MITYLIRRLLQLVPLMVGISILSFGIIHLAPGEPGLVLVTETTLVTEEFIAAERARLGLDQPIYIQYFRWFSQWIQGNWGRSMTGGRPVATLIWERLPMTILLSAATMLFILVIAIPVGMISALKQNSLIDHAATAGAFAGLAIPNFWFAMMLIIIFAIHLGWLPAAGARTLGARFDWWGPMLLDRLRFLVLPVLTLGLSGLAGLVRYMRSGMLEVLEQDYIRTARAKGVGERIVIIKHAARNALLPIVTILGFWVPALISGSAIVEAIFGWPGMGQLMIVAVFQRDLPLVMAVNTVGAGLVILGNLIADIAYAVVDPRIKYN